MEPRPDAARAAEIRYAALRADTRAGEGDRGLRTDETLRDGPDLLVHAGVVSSFRAGATSAPRVVLCGEAC